VKVELQKQLFDKYPKIFGDHTKPMTQTCMCWGIETGDGWYDIIDTLCNALTYTYSTSTNLNEEDGKRLGIAPYNFQDEKTVYSYEVPVPQLVADQVKEKFGTLRFYYHLELDSTTKELLQLSDKFSEDFTQTECSCYRRELQPKKKYPELENIIERYYNYISGMVHYAETASSLTCEVTGKRGVLHTSGGWLKVLNEEFAKTTSEYSDYEPYERTENKV